jgi:hypothetical protein
LPRDAAPSGRRDCPLSHPGIHGNNQGLSHKFFPIPDDNDRIKADTDQSISYTSIAAIVFEVKTGNRMHFRPPQRQFSGIFQPAFFDKKEWNAYIK